jgi:threonine dehydratase
VAGEGLAGEGRAAGAGAAGGSLLALVARRRCGTRPGVWWAWPCGRPSSPRRGSPEELGVEVRLKCESFQPIGAFKLRGAYTMVARLTEEERARGVVTYSSGNHAQAVAFAARAFGIQAVIVMPENAPRIKVEGTRRLGAEVIEEGTTSLARRAGRRRSRRSGT